MSDFTIDNKLAERGFELIPEWHKMGFSCDYCGTNKSVKYQMEVCDPWSRDESVRLYKHVCNKCVTLFFRRGKTQ